MARIPLDEYYQRTGVGQPGEISLARLGELQLGQLCAIPYENFDVLLGRGIHLSVDSLTEKLIRSRRGGYCFELNGLLLEVLKAEGFEVRPLLARVHLGGESTGRGHQVALVSVDNEEWIVDAGNGAYCPRSPLRFEHGIESIHLGTPYRIVPHELGHMVQIRPDDAWQDVYSFDLTPVIQADIDYGNHFTSTHPSSIFTKWRIAVLGHDDGQTVIFNDSCTIRRGTEEEKQKLPDDERYLQILRDQAGIELDASYDDLPPLAQMSPT